MITSNFDFSSLYPGIYTPSFKKFYPLSTHKSNMCKNCKNCFIDELMEHNTCTKNLFPCHRYHKKYRRNYLSCLGYGIRNEK